MNAAPPAEHDSYQLTLERNPKRFRRVPSASDILRATFAAPFLALLALPAFFGRNAALGNILFALLVLCTAASATLGAVLFLRLRALAARIRRANYLACPNCLFDLSGLVEPERCPECAFDVRYLDLPIAWKTQLRLRGDRLVAKQDRY